MSEILHKKVHIGQLSHIDFTIILEYIHCIYAVVRQRERIYPLVVLWIAGGAMLADCCGVVGMISSPFCSSLFGAICMW